MAYIPDDLFDELHSALSPMMVEPVMDKYGDYFYECMFCHNTATKPDRMRHSNDCLAVRLMRAMDAEKRNQLGSG